MIDTSSTIFAPDTKFTRFYDPEKKQQTSLKEIKNYIQRKMNKPLDASDLTYEEDSFAIARLTDDVVFRNILSKTLKTCINNKEQIYHLELLADAFGFYQEALTMKRCYKVMGQCSMDDSPRQHARQIAILAAQSHSWDIFLRAHLDIMNDRFERASDGSYAYGSRQTYLKELEELNLNIVDLVIGLSLRASNMAPNHYRGSIARLGRALSESKYKGEFEKKSTALIVDPATDEFNRGLIFMLYVSYSYYLDKEEGKQKRDFLRNNINSFPETIREAINELQEPKEKTR